MNYSIPFNRSDFRGKELEYINTAVLGGQISGDKSFTRKAQKLLETELGLPACLLTTSCTHALEMAALLLDVGPGDEVIVPSFTFVSTASAFTLRGATPVFSDIRPDTLNLDEQRLPGLITEKTKAIVPVHYAGVACEMDSIMQVAQEHNVHVVEDNAHGLFGKYRGRWLGSIGQLATQSFHETKNISCGEGGALLVNDANLLERAEIIREKGTNRSKFFRGEVDKYSWVDMGSSYVPSDLLAAYLLAQLEAKSEIQSAREKIWKRYQRELHAWSNENQIRQPTIPDDCEPAWHLYYLILPDLETRHRLIQFLQNRQILAVSHYVPLHSSPVGSRLTRQESDCPVTSRVSETLLRLPFYNSMSESEQTTVIDAIKSFQP